MMIRVALRVMPLMLVAIFTFAVFVIDTHDDRAREMARVETRQLAWAEGLVRCPDLWANMPLSACHAANLPRNTSAAD